jgi:signal transduction histidine kinase
VRDDGTGFAVDVTGATGGIIGMQERAHLLGGTFHVDSAPGAGTRVVANLPARPRTSQAAAPPAT